MKDDGTVWPALKPHITPDGRRLVDGDEYLRSAMTQSERDRAMAAVHVRHCCWMHGCKYGDDSCPVKSGALAQEFACESCRIFEAEDEARELHGFWATARAEGYYAGKAEGRTEEGAYESKSALAQIAEKVEVGK
jgi:hypothetical protein